jgi:hypothetical protein
MRVEVQMDNNTQIKSEEFIDWTSEDSVLGLGLAFSLGLRFMVTVRAAIRARAGARVWFTVSFRVKGEG